MKSDITSNGRRHEIRIKIQQELALFKENCKDLFPEKKWAGHMHLLKG